jgi:cytosine/adenosine deaminase-related metal-dependent hydrolase/SAM-dependent methyltransferase
VSVALTSVAKSPMLGDPSQRDKFALWSEAYDESPNPMLSLEERFLPSILPELAGKDVLDVGCGTGRWLEYAIACAPRSITGIDSSPEMLDRTRRKLGRQAVLVVGNATSLPIASMSADVVLASFVASYIADLPRFAAELRRVVRGDGGVYISDLHPATSVACKWQRGFRSAEKHVGLTTCLHRLRTVISCFEAAGFEAVCLLEPPFGLAELETFRSAGKLESFYAAAGLPAIYILQLLPVAARQIVAVQSEETVAGLRLSGARISLDADVALNGAIEIRGGRVASIMTSPQADLASQSGLSLELDGYLLLPGLINAHDHLEFGLYPNLGKGPYSSSKQWANNIQQSEIATIAAHQSVPKDVRLWWGAIRNLLCGVTTVCHHNPLHPELLKEEFPLRVISDFGWAHSLAMDSQVEEKFWAAPDDQPFVIHAGEGVDEASRDEIFQLDRAGMLDERTILVHGLALNADGITLLNHRNASLVWCPSSNRFLFGKTHSAETIASVRHLLLGSDSSLTAGGDLLDEVRIAHQEIGVPVEDLYRMLCQRAATAFRLRGGEGKIRPDAVADLIAVRDTGTNPAETLASLTAGDVELVIVRGRVQVASEACLRRLPPDLTAGLQPLQVGSELRWIRAPLGRLFREAEGPLGCEIKIGGKRVRHVCSAWL